MDEKQLAQWLRSVPPKSKNACIGLDGFVDRVLRVVDKRLSDGSVTYVKTLADYGRMLADASGLSLNVELLPVQTKLGGNGPIMANALAALGGEVACVGAFGLPETESVFLPLAERAALYSLATPAATDACEFDDGKLIASVLDPLNSLTWADICRRVGMETLTGLFDRADLIALNNWTMIPCMTEVWEHLQREVFPCLSWKERMIFIDLADPSKRPVKELSAALRTLRGFSRCGKVLLSCNQREAMQLSAACGIEPGAGPGGLSSALQGELGVWCVSIHTLSGSFACAGGERAEAPGFFVDSPKISVGGGDHFNAGLAFGLLGGLEPRDAMLLGSAVSGYYVRTGISPDAERLCGFLEAEAAR